MRNYQKPSKYVVVSFLEFIRKTWANFYITKDLCIYVPMGAYLPEGLPKGKFTQKFLQWCDQTFNPYNFLYTIDPNPCSLLDCEPNITDNMFY